MLVVNDDKCDYFWLKRILGAQLVPRWFSARSARTLKHQVIEPRIRQFPAITVTICKHEFEMSEVCAPLAVELTIPICIAIAEAVVAEVIGEYRPREPGSRRKDSWPPILVSRSQLLPARTLTPGGVGLHLTL